MEGLTNHLYMPPKQDETSTTAAAITYNHNQSPISRGTISSYLAG